MRVADLAMTLKELGAWCWLSLTRVEPELLLLSCCLQEVTNATLQDRHEGSGEKVKCKASCSTCCGVAADVSVSLVLDSYSWVRVN